RSDVLQTIRITPLQFRRQPVVVAVAERSGAGNAGEIRDRTPASAIDGGIGGSQIRAGVRIGLEKLVRLMVAYISEFERGPPRKLTLHGNIPLMHKRVPEIHRDTPERNRSGQGEDIGRVSGRESAGEERIDIEQPDTGRSIARDLPQIRREVE